MSRSRGSMKIGVLEEKSGCSRDTIHYYIRAGLLHAPKKTGATMAYYDSTHLDRLIRIRTLREIGMPLPAIRRLTEKLGENVTHDQLCQIGQYWIALGIHDLEHDSRRPDTEFTNSLPAHLGALAMHLRAITLASQRESIARQHEAVITWLQLHGSRRIEGDALCSMFVQLRAMARDDELSFWRELAESNTGAIVSALTTKRSSS